MDRCTMELINALYRCGLRLKTTGELEAGITALEEAAAIERSRLLRISKSSYHVYVERTRREREVEQ